MMVFDAGLDLFVVLKVGIVSAIMVEIPFPTQSGSCAYAGTSLFPIGFNLLFDY